MRSKLDAEKLLAQATRIFQAREIADRERNAFMDLVSGKRTRVSKTNLRELSDESLGLANTRRKKRVEKAKKTRKDPPVIMKRQPSLPSAVIIEFAKGTESFTRKQLVKELPGIDAKNLMAKLKRLMNQNVLIQVGKGFRLNRNITAGVSNGVN